MTTNSQTAALPLGEGLGPLAGLPVAVKAYSFERGQPAPPAVHPMDLDATELAWRIARGALTPTEAVDACLSRLAERDPSINAFTHVCAARARAVAAAQTAALARGEVLGPMAGVPVAVKDLEDVAGLPTSHGCAVFTGAGARPAAASSVQVARLQAAGAIVVGKTNVPVFGSAALCKNLPFGATRNPWDRARTSGGSSGGSAAAVAARIVPLATAADSGGSIRIPAAFCGAFGLKPSFGRIPEQEGAAFGFAKVLGYLLAISPSPAYSCTSRLLTSYSFPSHSLLSLLVNC